MKIWNNGSKYMKNAFYKHFLFLDLASCWNHNILLYKEYIIPSVRGMDQIYLKTPNPKCRLYWCFIEFIDRRYSQSCWYFRRALLSIAPLTFSLVSSPSPLPCVNQYTVKNAVELLGAPSRNSALMLKKYNITDEIFWLCFPCVFFYPANEQESSTLAQYKSFVLVSD